MITLDFHIQFITSKTEQCFVRYYNPDKDIDYLFYELYMLLDYLLVFKIVKFIKMICICIYIYLFVAKFDPHLCFVKDPKMSPALTFSKSGD